MTEEKIKASIEAEKIERAEYDERYHRLLKDYDGFMPKPGSFWLVVYECRYMVIAVSPDGRGFFAPGQNPQWWFSEITEWVREIVPPSE